jgi:hypothetical protein
MNAPVSVDYGPEEAAMQAYLEAGAHRAAALGNRGQSASPRREKCIPTSWTCIGAAASNL